MLARLFAGVQLGGAEIARMGVGGLLKDVAARPLPRAKATAPAPAQAAAPRGKPVAAIVLAAGQSSRMAPYNKLLVADRTGKPMLARVVDNLLSSAARPIIVVTGHREAELREALGKRPVQFVTAADYATGLSASLRAGIAAVPPDATAAVVCLGDMPLVTGRMIEVSEGHARVELGEGVLGKGRHRVRLRVALPPQPWVLAAADSYAHYATLPVGLLLLAALVELGSRVPPPKVEPPAEATPGQDAALV